MVSIVKNGRAHVLEMANRASVQKLSTESLSGLTSRMDNHESGLNVNAHGISNIAGLQMELNEKAYIDDVHTALDTKADVFTGYTGTLTVVNAVNFTTQTTTTATLNIVNGIIVSIT